MLIPWRVTLGIFQFKRVVMPSLLAGPELLGSSVAGH